MKTYLKTKVIILFCLVSVSLRAQTVIKTSFETTDSYETGSIDGQNNWAVEDGTAVVTTALDYVNTGAQGIQFNTTGTSEFETEYIGYSDDETGLSDIVYADMWLKVNTALSDEPFYIGGYDLTPDGSSKRTFFLQIDPTTESTADIKIYTSWNKYEVSDAVAIGSWIRISVCADYSATTYEVALNGTVVDSTFNFREDYTPSDKGRDSGLYEFHSLRFYHGGGEFDVSLDDLYIGTSEISDISFSEASTTRTVSVSQPEHGTITISPEQTLYEIGTEVTASVSVDEHYVFSAWTGTYSGSDNPLTFTVESNVTLGATVEIDENDPPASYTITLTQPTEGGSIAVDPEQTSYYAGTEVEFTASGKVGYDFTGWTGDLSGSDLTQTVFIAADMNVSAVFEAGVYEGRKVYVSDEDELEDALDDMLPGDTIILADGVYDCSSISLTALGGTNAQPVVVMAENKGQATITGSASFRFNQCSYITIRDLDFDVEVYTIFKLTGCDHIRICYNTLKNQGDDGSKWIIIGDVWDNASNTSCCNKVDHNLFDGKDDSGAWLVIDGNHGGEDGENICSRYDTISYNHFRNNGPRADNEKETIRIGMSDLSMSSAYCTVEYNLFEACNGDPEIISVKSCDNVVQNNTFVECLGTVSLRHGNRNVVRGNFFFGNGVTGTDTEGDEIGCGGVRVYGKDHKIYNNYFEGLTGSTWDAACTITNGDKANVDDSYSGLSSHFVPENLEFVHNTLVNNASDIEIGYDNNDNYGKAPVNCLIANNIVVQDENPVATVHNTSSLNGVSFAGNIFYTEQSGTWGDISFASNEAENIDPVLVQTSCRTPDECGYKVPVAIYKLASASPAIDATVANTFTYVDKDSEGQSAVNTRDLGADEYNTSDLISNGALDSGFVGPYAVEYIESQVTSVFLVSEDKQDVKAYPNPFRSTTTISYEGEVFVCIYDINGQLVDELTLINSCEWNAPDKGIYIAHLTVNGLIVGSLKLVAQ